MSMSALSLGTIAIWAAIAITCIGLAISRSQLNELLRLFSELEPGLWHEAGQPSGLFGSPRGRRFFAQDPSVDWLTHPPAWVAKSPEARTRLARARIGMAIGMAGLLILVGVVWWES